MSDASFVRTSAKIEQFIDGALDDQINSAIKNKSLVGGICMAIPLWGIETIVYAFCLWGSYSKISEISGVPFKKHFMGNVIGGFIVNIIVTFLLGLLLDFIPVVGWIGSFAVGYISIKISAMGYVKALKIFYGSKSKSDINIQRGINNMKTPNVPQ